MDYFEADHWSELDLVDLIEWENTAPNFTPEELASKGDGSLKIRKESLRKLQKVRHLYGKPLFVNSAYRDREHNLKVGSTEQSQHRKGRAFDLSIQNGEQGRELEILAKEVGFTAIGRYRTFIHIDDRPPKPNGQGFLWGLNTWG